MPTTASDARFRLRRSTREFADPATEHAYRVSAFRDARGLNRLAFMVTAFAFLAHSTTDYWLFGFGAEYFELLALRIAVVGLLALIFPLTASPPRIGGADAGVFALQLVVPAAYFAIVLMMPLGHVTGRVSVVSVTSLLILIGEYLFVANRLRYVAAAGVATSVGYFALSIHLERLTTPALALEGAVHALGNLLGILSVYRSGLMRRRQFALSRGDAALNQRLEAQARLLAAQAAELARARDEALQANRAKSEFLAYMSHELRSPMNAIIGFSEIMKNELMGRMSPPRYREYADDIHGSAKHLLSLINDILDLSKAEAGKLQLNEAEVDVASAVEAVRRLVAVRAEASHIVLRAQPAANLPPLAGDERMVKQMVLNLLANAIKFTPARGSVTLSAGKDSAGALFIAVADTGPGIAATDIPRILEAYGRTDAAEKGSAEGTGLGLTLVKAMIELHGGALAIESKPGAGSTFTLRFPPERTLLAKAA
jgi:signal transduction histidine kinase